VAWLWLDVARAAVVAGKNAGDRAAFLQGKRQAARYFVDYELPKIDAWLGVVATRNATCLAMQDEWFET
jgi:butyryl-CoA dehydrogenase